MYQTKSVAHTAIITALTCMVFFPIWIFVVNPITAIVDMAYENNMNTLSWGFVISVPVSIFVAWIVFRFGLRFSQRDRTN